MQEAKAALYGVIVGIIITTLLGYVFCERMVLKEQCSITQGRYDFCVQKISYEVKK